MQDICFTNTNCLQLSKSVKSLLRAGFLRLMDCRKILQTPILTKYIFHPFFYNSPIYTTIIIRGVALSLRHDL